MINRTKQRHVHFASDQRQGLQRASALKAKTTKKRSNAVLFFLSLIYAIRNFFSSLFRRTPEKKICTTGKQARGYHKGAFGGIGTNRKLLRRFGFVA